MRDWPICVSRDENAMFSSKNEQLAINFRKTTMEEVKKVSEPDLFFESFKGIKIRHFRRELVFEG